MTTRPLKAWLKGCLSCLSITLAVLVFVVWLALKACDRYCPDTEAQRIQSPDGRYLVTQTFGDSCGGATVAFSHTVRLSRKDAPQDGVALIETYGSPKDTEIRWSPMGRCRYPD